jgi:three-Cys-motif partner protein
VPVPTVWSIEPHTAAKHKILEEYLKAWYPILSKRNQRILYIDGFAGPGIYEKGEIGSPIIALQCLLDHSLELCQRNREYNFILIEKDKERAEILERTIQEKFHDMPKNVRIRIYSIDFETAMKSLLAAIDKENKSLAPTFAFIDPFGYGGLPFEIIKRILGFRSCEVFINFAYNPINRFIQAEDDPREATFDELFGTEKWRDIRPIKNPDERLKRILALYQMQLNTVSKYVKSFEMIDKMSKVSYHLFFASNHIDGLSYMKRAMLKVDPRGTFSFSDTTDAGQSFLVSYDESTKFEDEADLLYKNLVGHTLTKKQLEEYCIVHTTFLQLWSGSLKILEDQGKLEFIGTRKRYGTYPSGCKVNFKKIG